MILSEQLTSNVDTECIGSKRQLSNKYLHLNCRASCATYLNIEMIAKRVDYFPSKLLAGWLQ